MIEKDLVNLPFLSIFLASYNINLIYCEIYVVILIVTCYFRPGSSVNNKMLRNSLLLMACLFISDLVAVLIIRC